MELTVQEHREILHATLDIPTSVFSRSIRKYRELYGDKIIVPPDAIEYMGDMQRLFFERLYTLPKWMQELHLNIFHKLVATEWEKYKQLTGNDFDTPKNAPTVDGKVHSLHENYLECRKAISKEIIAIIKKNLR